MLDVQNGLISIQKFCYMYVVTDNQYVFECRGEQIKGYQSQGMSYNKTFKKVFGVYPPEL